MISKAINVQDRIAVLEDLPAYQLRRGQVGTVVEMITDHIFDVEFVDPKTGETYAKATLRTPQVMRLLYESVG